MQSRVLSQENKRKTETVSFRIDSSLYSLLEHECKGKGINLNALVSQILSRYIGWWRYETRLKLIPFSKDLLRELFQFPKKEEVCEIARRLADSSGRELVLFLFQQANLGTVIKFLDIFGSHFDAYEHLHDGKTHFITIHHDVNLNFSLFIKEYVSSIIQATGPRAVRFETVSTSAVTFSFEG